VVLHLRVVGSGSACSPARHCFGRSLLRTPDILLKTIIRPIWGAVGKNDQQHQPFLKIIRLDCSAAVAAVTTVLVGFDYNDDAGG
jgi:hypothetical protein